MGGQAARERRRHALERLVAPLPAQLARWRHRARRDRPSALWGQPRFASEAEPEVSVVIPVYGQTETTLACLRSLSALPAGRRFEVVVVDDHSPGDTRAVLREIEGIVLVENDVNLGFLRSSNRGLESARGDYVCLLNNDTTVTEGWLGALLETFEAHPEAGLVGPRLLFPNGRIQEAGGIVCRDGSCEHFGRTVVPGASRYAHVRPVDYVSAACAVLPRALIERLGGFDEAYAPAYYEDTDLAFRVRAAGREVLHQPAARVFHHEGVTHGRDPSQGLKRHQTLNRSTFRERWEDVLRAGHPCPGRRSADAADRRRGPRLLFLTRDAEDPGLRFARRLAAFARPAWWSPRATSEARARLGARGIEPLGPLEAPNLAAALEWARRVDGVVLGDPSPALERRLQFILPDMPVLATEATPAGARARLADADDEGELCVVAVPATGSDPADVEQALWRALRRR